MTEALLWGWLRKARKHFGPRLHMRRVENGISEGDCDVDGILSAQDFALELKVAKRPARDTTPLRFGEPIKDSQLEFCTDRLAAGGAHAWVIRVGVYPDAKVYVVPGWLGTELVLGLTESDLRDYHAASPARAIELAVQMRSTP